MLAREVPICFYKRSSFCPDKNHLTAGQKYGWILVLHSTMCITKSPKKQSRAVQLKHMRLEEWNREYFTKRSKNQLVLKIKTTRSVIIILLIFYLTPWWAGGGEIREEFLPCGYEDGQKHNIRHWVIKINSSLLVIYTMKISHTNCEVQGVGGCMPPTATQGLRWN